MEDKNTKPVDKQELKKPTGKSATGKPLDGIEIRPQLKDLGQGQRNEDAVVLADTLDEKKALTLVQRQRRARAIRAKEPKMQRAKELAKHRLASDDKLKARAIVQARKIVKKRFASRRGIPYAELSTAEKIQVDTAVDKKVNLIKKLATRLLPRIRKMEVERLASFTRGAPLKNFAPAPVSENINQIVESLNNKSSLHLVDIINESIHTLNEQNDSMAITLKRMLHAVLPEDNTTFTIMKKAERTGIPFSTLREVFERGVFAWDNDERVTQEQYAFSRVNSYIAKGRAWSLDADLREEKVVNTKLDTNFDEFLEACWVGYKAVGTKKKGNRMVPNCVPEQATNESLWANIHAKRKRIKAGSGERMRKPGEKGAPVTLGVQSAQESAHKETAAQERQEIKYVKRNSADKEKDVDPHHIRRAHAQIKNKIIDESGNTPYVKPHIESGQTKQTGWKASNKHGNVKYFGLSFKSSAHKHAGITEDTSTQREDGTASLVKKYQKDTPGQEKADINKTFSNRMEEVRSSDVEGVIVRTASGKTIVRKQKRNRKIIGTGNLTDGNPNDTL